MGQYRLVAFDMDGTLLDSHKHISRATQQAVRLAAERGATIVLNTGRCMAELTEYMKLLPEVRYINSVSGGLVCDRVADRDIYSSTLDIDTVKKILKLVESEDVMIHFLNKESIVQMDKVPDMYKYHMEAYKDMYERVTDQWEDIIGQYLAAPFRIPKLNLYHTSSEARNQTRQKILAEQLNVELVDAETTSLEISAQGTDKGNGLEKLCQYLNIPLSQTIVVGDADNDIAAMKKAGLAVAMKNANEHVKALADVIVSDNDHDGCKEVLQNYGFIR